MLWIACILGALCVIPYAHYLGQIPLSIPATVGLVGMQSAVLYGVVLWLSSVIIPKTDLSPLTWQKSGLLQPIVIGTAVAIILLLLESTAFSGSALSQTQRPPFWAGALAAVYGGFNEEVLSRLFLLTLFYYLLGKCFTVAPSNRNYLLWTANAAVALFFGLGHLPVAFQLIPPTALEIVRILALNGIAALAFGWLYFTRGLWAAVIAHFTADIIIHAVWVTLRG